MTQLGSAAEWGRRSLHTAAEALRCAADRLDSRLEQAVQIIVDSPGKVVVTGIGKSGWIGRKIASTFCSVGTPAVFLHPAEAIHGDLGLYQQGEPTILISNSGTTDELVRLLPDLRRVQSPMIAILGRADSPLGRSADVVLDASVGCEADPHGVVPTTSAVVALAVGDALAIALMSAREFSRDDFGVVHPGGQLGRNLRLEVRAVMHSGPAVAWVRGETGIRDLVVAMTQYPLGAACVVDREGRLQGLITDGDLRRALQTHEELRGLTAEQVMTRQPLTIAPSARLQEALRRMEERSSQISVLPVVDPSSGVCLGLLRLHDIYHGRPESR